MRLSLLMPNPVPEILRTSLGPQFLDAAGKPGYHINVVESPRT
jgi:hypothetical protein